MSDLKAFYDYVDQHQNDFINELRQVVAIKSVSASVEYRSEVIKMGEWFQAELEKLGATTKRVEPGKQELEGQTIDLPPVILGRYGNDPNKRTVLVYGHYDVQPALKEDGWNTDPFTLTEDEENRLIGRGATDDKGPILGWLLVIKAFKELGMEFPVNLITCFEGMEESSSVGLDEIVYQEANGFFSGVDCVCISDNYWLGKDKPSLTYGLRGVSYFHVSILGPKADLHSGVFGGTVHEPMTDLINLFSTLVKPDGKILIPGIMDQVAPLSNEEDQSYNNLDFSMDTLHQALGAKNTIHENVKTTLQHRWRYPSLSIHGIEGAFYSPGDKTVIPAKVIGKFSIRTVPNMEPEQVTKLVEQHIQTEFQKLNSKNQLQFTCTSAGKPWYSSFNHWNFVAGTKAVEKVFNCTPEYTREGGSIPVTLTFEDALKKNVLLLPMGACDDGAHSINEKIDRRNFIEGIKLLGTYLDEIKYDLNQTKLIIKGRNREI
ncbi:CNDP dipeptidase [Neoconidiobolus thromboides FSU 785]|nr:CNDP dipeptidase [Neoconidiobolus thromboides FSU 785]